MNEVLQYIQQLKDISGYKNPQYVFTHGKCGIFAKKLWDRFGGNILCIPEYHHFVLYLDGKMYDATGNVTKKYSGMRSFMFDNMTVKQLAGYEF